MDFTHEFAPNQTIREIIQSIGVPHTEIDLIIVNGKSVDFTYLLNPGDRVAVYPMFETLDITPLIRLRPKPLRFIKFILDVHLGKLAKYLRLLGFDSLFEVDYEDETIAEISKQEHRIILTRDKGLLKINLVTHGYWVRALDPTEQMKEIIARFDLKDRTEPFTRCLECNEKLVSVSKKEIKGYLPANTGEYYQDFKQCPKCHKVYWEGSHF